MSVLTGAPTFLYPHSRQYPFDEVTEKIVRAIEKRNWNVPGITLKFDTYSTGEAKYQYLQKITGEDFSLYFMRVQGKLTEHWNDIAAVYRICIPKQSFEVFADESGPKYYLYVGDNWEEDKNWFMNSIKVKAKLNNEPRRYLRYRGDTLGKRAKVLVTDNDLEHEYSPEGDEPIYFNLDEKFKEFTEWLEEYVLNYILKYPETDEIQPPALMPKLITYEGTLKTIYSICSWNAAQRIQKGKKNPKELPPEDRHAYIGRGQRLVPLWVQREEKFPEIAYDGFIWGEAISEEKMKLTDDVENAMSSLWGGDYLVEIELKYANEVYVVDNSKYEETRQKLFKEIHPRDTLTDEELGEALAARGATIIPITEYKGDYKEPLVLIKRELDFDEIKKIIEIKD